jgi:hypothetical protein
MTPGKSIKLPQQTPLKILQEMQNIRSASELTLAIGRSDKRSQKNPDINRGIDS